MHSRVFFTCYSFSFPAGTETPGMAGFCHGLLSAGDAKYACQSADRHRRFPVSWFVEAFEVSQEMDEQLNL
jgi:hypothetical protein